MSKQPWKKILYIKQDYADNFVDDTFLSDLQKNLDLKTYSFGCLVRESSAVAQEFSSVVLFVALFYHLEAGKWDPLAVSLMTLCCGVISHLSSHFNSLATNFWSLVQDAFKGITFVLLLFVLSPILESLTESISTDTIYAMTTAMFLVHLIFHIYGSDAEIVSGSVSLNAGMFGAVCLSSRLSTTLHVFALMLSALWLFAVLPKIRGRLKKQHELCVPVLAAILFLPTMAVLVTMSLASSVVYVSCVLITVLVCPILFVRLQSYKNIIYGPWDEAHPVSSRKLTSHPKTD